MLWIFFSATCALYLSHTHNLPWPIGVGVFCVQVVLGLFIGVGVVEAVERIGQERIDAFIASGGEHIVAGVIIWFGVSVLFSPAFAPFFGTSRTSTIRVMLFGFLIFLGGLILALGPLIIWYKCRNRPDPVPRRLTLGQSNEYRRAARKLWRRLNNGVSAMSRNLEIQYRIPLKWSHLFPTLNPNRISNLIGVDEATHDLMSNRWRQFEAAHGPATPPSADQVLQQEARIEQEFGGQFRSIDDS